jgi:hypothetical protein
MNVEHIVEPGRQDVIKRTTAHDEHAAISRLHAAMINPGSAQHFSARALDEFEIIGVINNPRRIGVFIENPQRINICVAVHACR